MRNPRNQLIIAIVFALLLGLIIVGASRCSSSATPSARTATPKVTTPVVRATGTITTTTGMTRTTDVVIVPPGGQPAATATPVSVGPLPPATIVAQPTAGSSTGGTGSVVSIPAATPVVAASAPTPTVAIPEGGIIHTVKAGETLSTIAKKYGTTTAIIAQANGITNPSLIRTGQKLRIPGVTAAATATKTTTTRTYVVKSGDTLLKIAAKYGTTVDAIVKANNLKNASLIRVGQTLIIP